MRFGPRLPVSIGCIGLATVAGCFITTPAAAQGLLQSLFGWGGTSSPQPAAPQGYSQGRQPASPMPQLMTPGGRPYGSLIGNLGTAGGRGGALPQASFDDDMRSGRGERTYRTMCVRLCDGFYFPISFATTRAGFFADQKQCTAACGEARLYVYPNPGGDIAGMTDLSSRPYSLLPTAFRYRKAKVAGCLCRAQPWSEQEQQRHRQYTRDANQEAYDQLLRALKERADAKLTAMNRAAIRPDMTDVAAMPDDAATIPLALVPRGRTLRTSDAQAAPKRSPTIVPNVKIAGIEKPHRELGTISAMPDTIAPEPVVVEDVDGGPPPVDSVAFDLTPKSLAMTTPTIQRIAVMPLGGRPFQTTTKPEPAIRHVSKKARNGWDTRVTPGQPVTHRTQVPVALAQALQKKHSLLPAQAAQNVGAWPSVAAPSPPASAGLLSGLLSGPKPVPVAAYAPRPQLNQRRLQKMRGPQAGT